MRYAFDKTRGDCRQFQYGGCGGNGNNFATANECRKKCVPSKGTTTTSTTTLATPIASTSLNVELRKCFCSFRILGSFSFRFLFWLVCRYFLLALEPAFVLNPACRPVITLLFQKSLLPSTSASTQLKLESAPESSKDMLMTVKRMSVDPSNTEVAEVTETTSPPSPNVDLLVFALDALQLLSATSVDASLSTTTVDVPSAVAHLLHNIPLFLPVSILDCNIITTVVVLLQHFFVT